MKTQINTRNIKATALALALAALPAAAHGNGYDRRADATEVRGGVEIVRETPQGTVVVSAEVGHPRPVVVAEKKVVVVEERRAPREVTVIRHEEAPRTEVIREKHRTIVIKRDRWGHIVNRTVILTKGRGHEHKDYEDHDWDRD